MTTSITKLGDNAQRISYTSNTSIAEMQTALDTVMVAQGWELFDAAAGASARCYRAPIADGNMAFKYMVLDFGTANYMLCKVYEAWNATTHVGTNMAVVGDNTQYNQQVSLSAGGVMWVFANARYAAFFSRTSTLVYGDSQTGSFTGCFEISRDNPEEVPGSYPAFAWVNGGLAIGYNASGTQLCCFSLPRTVAGQVGNNAYLGNSIATLVGRTTTANGTAAPLWQQIPTAVNVLSTSGAWNAFTPYAVTAQYSGTTASAQVLRGRFYGLKVLPRNIGSGLDSINLKVDSNLFLDDAQVAPKQHLILPEKTVQCRFALPL
jgi:hypothetical protein